MVNCSHALYQCLVLCEPQQLVLRCELCVYLWTRSHSVSLLMVQVANFYECYDAHLVFEHKDRMLKLDARVLEKGDIVAVEGIIQHFPVEMSI